MTQPMSKMALPVKKCVQLYYDVLSPHAWIAFELLGRHKESWGIDVKLRPVSQSELRRRTYRHDRGNTDKEIADIRHICQDAEVLGKQYNIPIKTPQNVQNKIFYRGSQAAMRLLYAVNQARPDQTEVFSRTLWERVWKKDEDITQRKSLIEVGMMLGHSAQYMEELLSKTKEKSTTMTIRTATEDALRKGVYDAPSLLLEGDLTAHLINGSDKIHTLAQIIGTDHMG